MMRQSLTFSQLWLLYTKLPTPQSKQAAAGVALRKEVVKLHREMTNTSAQDDFAKWAKLRRQHDKKKAEYEQNGKTMTSVFLIYEYATDRTSQHNPSSPSAPTSIASPPPSDGSALLARASSSSSGSLSKRSSGSRKAGHPTTSSGYSASLARRWAV
jgi:hypothetical protein